MATRSEWHKRILLDLGGSGTDPDLTPEDLNNCLERALELWNKHRPFACWFPFEVPASETVAIVLFSETVKNDPQGNPYGFVARILNVTFSETDRGAMSARFGGMDGFYLRWGMQGPRLYFEMQVGQRNYERLTGSRPDWRWDAASRVLYLSSPSRPMRAMVLASRPRYLEEISYDHESDFRTLAVAAAKKVLAQVLTRRGPMYGPGGNITTDATELRQEGKEEWAEIKENLETSLASVPPPVYIG